VLLVAAGAALSVVGLRRTSRVVHGPRSQSRAFRAIGGAACVACHEMFGPCLGPRPR
jgi:hypothetical protein